MTTIRIPIEPQPPRHWSIPPARLIDGKLYRYGASGSDKGDPEIKCPHQPGDRLPCECVSCCDGEHAGSCRDCAGWMESDGVPCEHCDETGVCPVCEGTAAGQVVQSVGFESVAGVGNWVIETRDEA